MMIQIFSWDGSNSTCGTNSACNQQPKQISHHCHDDDIMGFNKNDPDSQSQQPAFNIFLLIPEINDAHSQPQPSVSPEQYECCGSSSANPLESLIHDFEQFDLNKDDVLQDDELKQAEKTLEDESGTIAGLRANMDELMFASIDPNKAAWHGLTLEDLAKIDHQMDHHGMSLNDQGDQLRSEISKERNVASDPNGFRDYVNQQQRQNRIVD